MCALSQIISAKLNFSKYSAKVGIGRGQYELRLLPLEVGGRPPCLTLLADLSSGCLLFDTRPGLLFRFDVATALLFWAFAAR